MQDLIREVISSVNSGGRIPALDLIKQILQSVITTIVRPSQVHLAYKLASAIPISADPQNLICFILNLPVIEQQNMYRLKSVLNNTHLHLETPATLAYHDPSPYLIPNLNTCTKTKVPRQYLLGGATVHIDHVILHHLDCECHEVDTEILDAFKGHDFSIDTSLHQQLLVERTKVVKFSLKPAGLTASFFKPKNQPPSYMENTISLVALGLLLSGWIITAIAAHVMYKCIQKLQAKLDSILFITPNSNTKPTH